MYVISAGMLMAAALAQIPERDSIAFVDLNDFGWAVQKRLNETEFDALVERSPCDYAQAIHSWREYFTTVELDGMSYAKRIVTVSSLQDRFAIAPLGLALKVHEVKLPSLTVERNKGCQGCMFSFTGGHAQCKTCSRNHEFSDHYRAKELG